MSYSFRQAALATAALALCHVGLAFAPGPTISPSINLVLFATNLYVLHCAASVLRDGSGRGVVLFALGYFILFLLLMVVLRRQPLFVLLVLLYASVYRSPLLLSLFGVFVLSFVVLQPYAVETFVPLALIVVVSWRLRDEAPFLRIALAGGLFALALVLLPLLHLSVQDSAQTLWHTLRRPEVLSAVGYSLSTSAIATLLIAVWGIPLAYALARLEFRGRGVVEVLIDLPILVPQSVAGISLMILLGPGSPIGSALEERFGLVVAGRTLGIILAQVFVASPFLIKAALAAFEAVPRQLEMASRTLGAGAARTFLWVALPLAGRGIAIGMVLAFARAISELGAILLFAPSPITAPVLVHTEFLEAGISESRPVAILLLIVCVWVFILLQLGAAYLPFGRRPNPEARR